MGIQMAFGAGSIHEKRAAGSGVLKRLVVGFAQVLEFMAKETVLSANEMCAGLTLFVDAVVAKISVGAFGLGTGLLGPKSEESARDTAEPSVGSESVRLSPPANRSFLDRLRGLVSIEIAESLLPLVSTVTSIVTATADCRVCELLVGDYLPDAPMRPNEDGIRSGAFKGSIAVTYALYRGADLSGSRRRYADGKSLVCRRQKSYMPTAKVLYADGKSFICRRQMFCMPTANVLYAVGFAGSISSFST